MEFAIQNSHPASLSSDCIVVGIFDRRKLPAAAKALDQALDGLISRVLKRGDLDGEIGQSLWLHHVPGLNVERILLVGCGKEKEFTDRCFQKATRSMIQAVQHSGTRTVQNFLTDLKVRDRDLGWTLAQTVLLVRESLYRFDEHKSKARKNAVILDRMLLAVPEDADPAPLQQSLSRAMATADGIHLARDLGNRPGNVCTPRHLADQAREIKKGCKDLKLEILKEDDMEKLGMGALLALSRGSEQPPRLIVMEYRGGKDGDRPVALVGKGITFDTGGISIKPAAEMDEMKFDMCGAAAVLGVMKAVTELQLPINVVGVIAAAENMPDGKAIKPGDIVTTLSGQTVEVLNTDAEGRLVLCDALSYVERYKPEVVVDMATLTGACIIALGHHISAVLGNDSDLIQELLKAGRQAMDPAWELPLDEVYQDQLRSNFADIGNIGGRPAGTITAACFLSRFTEHYRWAHIDIAGVAWKSGKEKGATGRPVPLLMQFLFNRLQG